MAEFSGILQLPVNAVSNRLVFLQTESGNQESNKRLEKFISQ